MKWLKKPISVILCAAIIFSCFCAAAQASEKEDNPTIMISGFLCSQLYMNFGKENEEKVWGIEADSVTKRIKNDFPRLAATSAGLLLGRTEEFGETLGSGAAYVLEKLRCNPDGSPIYPVSVYPNNPATSNVKYMRENGFENNLYEKNMCTHLSALTDPSRVYCFQYDSRMDAITVAGELNDFIKAVKEYTGADKVNIFALSFGGLIVSTYLYLYGDDNDAQRVVMSVPAIGGTVVPDRIFRGNIDLPIETVVEFFETVLKGEHNLARAFEGDNVDKLNSIIKGAAPAVSSCLMYWSSLWSLCLTDLYEQLKADFLDPVESRNIIEKNDILHYEIMPKFAETYKKCMANGTSISILCGTGSDIATGGGINGDLVLPTSGVSGAVCAPLGERFPDGYTGVKTSCSDPEHNHISPSMEIDASSAYLPENTWFINNQYHGQYFYEEYTKSLVTKLLLTDDIKDVYSDPNYPQFENSNHAYRTLHLKFNSSPAGYLTSKDTALTVENISSDSCIKILSVVSNGVDLDFDASGKELISPGDSVDIPFSGEVPEVGATAAQITVSYVKVGSMNPLCTADFRVMIDNGEAPQCGTGFVSSEFESRLQKAIPDWFYSFLSRHSLKDTAECIYNSVTEALNK